MSIAGPILEAHLSEVELDKQAIRRTCLKAMKARKSTHTVRLQAASLLAGIQGIYGSARRVASATYERRKKAETDTRDRTLGTLLKVG